MMPSLESLIESPADSNLTGEQECSGSAPLSLRQAFLVLGRQSVPATRMSSAVPGAWTRRRQRGHCDTDTSLESVNHSTSAEPCYELQ